MSYLANMRNISDGIVIWEFVHNWTMFILQMTYTYHWNDWDCNSQLADYICEAPCIEVP